jgi:Fic family protein
MPSPVSYHAGRFPPERIEWTQLISLIGPANAALARYDGLLAAIPNAAVLLSPMTTQEAVLSSRIEGTQATMGEVLEYEAAGAPQSMDPARRQDIEEVLNYRRAMRQATQEMERLPLCNRVIRHIHETLLSGVRGHDKGRGRFRTIQNYIARAGRPIEEARYVPIDAAGLGDGMARWEKYVHEPGEDALVQLAVIHAEFESLHPFLDGNGRIGRILIPLFLYERKLLSSPMFYLSEYLEAHRDEYYERLLAVSRDDDWTGWCRFFLEAIQKQARANEAKARRILNLYQRHKDGIVERTHSQFAIRALDFLFGTPIFNSSDFIAQSRIPGPTARRILKLLSGRRGILKTMRAGSGRRPAMYAFNELLEITESRNVR